MKTPFLTICFLGSLLVGIFFAFQSTYKIFEFWRLDQSSPAKISRWEVEAIGEEYGIKIFYTFLCRGEIREGEYAFPPPYYWNEWSAVASLKEMAKRPWEVFYSSKNPSYTSLQREIPLYSLIKSLICLVLAAYFFVLNKRMIIYFKN